jgi:glycosyltransferase involved in cell wall biosynthesis
MRILYTTPFVPYPPTYGGTMISYHHLKGLAERGHELVMILPLRRRDDRDGAHVLGRLGTVRAVPVKMKSPAQFALESLVSGASLRIARHRFAAIEAETARALREEKRVDAVYLDTLFSTYLLPLFRSAIPHVPVVLLELNLESQVLERMARHGRGLSRLIAGWETKRLRAAEKIAHREVDAVLTLSEEDARAVRQTESARAHRLGPGITTFPGEAIPAPPAELIVLFFGSYQWPPNVDAAKWMAQEIWPRVLKREPRARLVLAGQDPRRMISHLAAEHSSIEVTGFVDDATRRTRSSTVCVAPLRVGGGVRIKILEALANERPVVATTLGAEGLGLVAERQALIADDADAFAGAITRLLQDRAVANQLARQGRQFVEQHFAWPRVMERLEKFLEQAIHERAQRGVIRPDASLPPAPRSPAS